MNETKKKILTVSLELFSKKGYSAVSIRDICKIVQIKESSVYYHFKNKQAILEELLIQFEDIATGMMQQLEESLSKPINPEKNNFYKRICEIFFEEYLMDGFCNKMMRLLLTNADERLIIIICFETGMRFPRTNASNSPEWE